MQRRAGPTRDDRSSMASGSDSDDVDIDIGAMLVSGASQEGMVGDRGGTTDRAHTSKHAVWDADTVSVPPSPPPLLPVPAFLALAVPSPAAAAAFLALGAPSPAAAASPGPAAAAGGAGAILAPAPTTPLASLVIRSVDVPFDMTEPEAEVVAILGLAETTVLEIERCTTHGGVPVVTITAPGLPTCPFGRQHAGAPQPTWLVQESGCWFGCKAPECVHATAMVPQPLALAVRLQVALGIARPLSNADVVAAELESVWRSDDDGAELHRRVREFVFRPTDLGAADVLALARRGRYVYSTVESAWYMLRRDSTWRRGLANGNPDGTMQADMLTTLTTLLGFYEAVAAEEWATMPKPAAKEARATLHRAQMYAGKAHNAVSIAALMQRALGDDTWLFEKLDPPNLLAFSDWVLELDAPGRRPVARPIRPGDYIRRSTGYPLPLSIDEDAAASLVRAGTTLWPDADTDHARWRAWLTVNSYCLSGMRPIELHVSGNGAGANGKDTLTELQSKTFGSYHGSLSSEVVTLKAGSRNEASSFAARLPGLRTVEIPEIPVDRPVQTDFMCLYGSGRDVLLREFYGREDVKLRITWTMFLWGNGRISYTVLNHAIRRREWLFEMPRNFVPADKVMFEMDAAIDPRVRVRCRSAEWRDAFMWLLLREWPRVHGLPSLPMPLECSQYAEATAMESNPVATWFSEHIGFAADKTTHKDWRIKSTTVHTRFRDDTGSKMDIVPFCSHVDALRCFKRSVVTVPGASGAKAMCYVGVAWKSGMESALWRNYVAAKAMAAAAAAEPEAANAAP